VEAVRIALEKDPFVDAGQVRVTASGRVVHLTGLVPTEIERERAEDDAWCIFGVDNVINDVKVA
jgi:osmotically-inducible protein OsmY